MNADLEVVSNIDKDENIAEFITQVQNNDMLLTIDKDANTLTHLAALKGNAKLLQALKEKNLFEINKVNLMLQTPLFFAILSGSIETVRLFLEEGAQFDVTDVNGDTPLHISSKVNILEISEFISTVGVNLNAVNRFGETALHVSCHLNSFNSTVALVAAGVNPNMVTLNGDSALHISIQERSPEAVRILLNRGADPGLRNKTGNLPIHLACLNSDLLSVQLLSEHNSPINTYNHNKLTALHIAAKNGDHEIVRHLLYFGADCSIGNGFGITADVMAYAQGHNETGKLISKMTPERLMQYLDQFQTLSKEPRIKLKLFGSSMSGKTTLSNTFRSGIFSNYLKKKMKSLTDFKDWLSEGDSKMKCVNGFKSKSKFFYAEHDAYTRGIEIKNSNEFNIWEFSGYKPYYFLYDFFIGNTSCIHAILYSLTDSPSVQREKIKFWLDFIHSRLPVREDCVVEAHAKVVIIATHADEISCTRDGEGYLHHIGAARMLQDFRREYEYKLIIAPELHILDATYPNTIEMKFLKQSLCKLRGEILKEIPMSMNISEIISSQLDEWGKSLKAPIQYWFDFIQLVQMKTNPLCTDTNLRESVQFLQYTGDLIVLETGDDNDLIVLNPSWLLSEVVGYLFSEETIQQARITGSFTSDDLQFLIAETENINIVVKILSALECCTACIVVPDDFIEEELNNPESRQQYFQSFYDNALVANSPHTYPQSSANELQLEIPRLNLMKPFEDEWDSHLSGDDIRRTGVQFCGQKLQLVHVFPRIQCRLRRTVIQMVKSPMLLDLQDETNPNDMLHRPELLQWLHGSKLTLCKGLINIFITYEEIEQAIEVKVETYKQKTLLAFTCFYEIVGIVRGALEDITSQLCISNCLLVFSECKGCCISKEIITQPALFQLLENEHNSIHPESDIQSAAFTSPYLLQSLFLNDMQVANSYIYNSNISGNCLTYEVLLEVVTSLGNNDGLSSAQLIEFSQLLGLKIQDSNSIFTNEKQGFVFLLNQLMKLLVTWCSHSFMKGSLKQLIISFNAVELKSLSSQILEKAPIFVLKNKDHEKVNDDSERF